VEKKVRARLNGRGLAGGARGRGGERRGRHESAKERLQGCPLVGFAKHALASREHARVTRVFLSLRALGALATSAAAAANPSTDCLISVVDPFYLRL